MRTIPRTQDLDAVLPLLFRDGYLYITRRCDAFGTDLFEARALGQPAVFLRGEEAGRLFYDQELFRRAGAAPGRVLRTLLGRGGIHGLDGEEHLDRKRMFLSLFSESEVARLAAVAREEWGHAAARWERREGVRLFDEAREILCRAICRWSGVPLAGDEARGRADELGAMVDGFASVGPRYWRARSARVASERWAESVIEAIRNERLEPPPGSAALTIAQHIGVSGRRLDAHTAAVELLNVLRPTVAVSYLIAFAALALHRNPGWRERLRAAPADATLFAEEVRRFYPFAPVMAAVARRNIPWRGYLIPEGRLVVFDLFGTNHDPRIWGDPGEFRPERFRLGAPSPFGFVPQGGGDAATGHRCAGEGATVALLKDAAGVLAAGLDYEVPMQDFSIALTRIPAIPASRFRITRVRRREGAAWAEVA